MSTEDVEDDSTARGKRDGRGGRRGRGRGRGRNRSNNNRGGGGGVDQSKWRALERPYREWLVSSGIAINAAAFNSLTVEQLISARSAYGSAKSRTTEESDLMILLRSVLISQTNPYAVISYSHDSKEDSEETKEQSIAFYGLGNKSFCQVLGQQPEQIKIVNAHVWPRNGTSTLPVFGLQPDDVHNPRNVLRLHQCIERAFDRRQMVFVADAHDRIVVKLLASEIRSTLLKGTATTFSDIDGLPLITKVAGHFPYRQLLAHHSVLAHRWAREQGWISDDLAAEEVNAAALMGHSLDPEAQERIKLLWRK